MSQVLKSSLSVKSLNSILKTNKAFQASEVKITGEKDYKSDPLGMIDVKKILRKKRHVTFKEPVDENQVNYNKVQKNAHLDNCNYVFQEVNSKISEMLGSQREFFSHVMEVDEDKSNSNWFKYQNSIKDLKMKDQNFV
ncbi:unnamed protein product [Blepharisma stoltei]|uniref:Uncharacterized protein n=1 Tax=Blepharisma stoltei TaxID=1481888 RepID=A0AAU9K8D4_9CILI|nr:unnamed protein product [Blepharisma stoltei]